MDINLYYLTQLSGWNHGLPSVESLLVVKKMKSYCSEKLVFKQKDVDSNIQEKLESGDSNLRMGLNRMYSGLEAGEVVSPPHKIDESLLFTEFMDGERNSSREVEASVAPCDVTPPFEEIIESIALNHPVLNVLNDRIKSPSEINQRGSQIIVQNAESPVICASQQQVPIIDKEILINGAVDTAQPPAINPCPLPRVLFGEIEPLTGLTYTQIVMITILVRDCKGASLVHSCHIILKLFPLFITFTAFGSDLLLKKRNFSCPVLVVVNHSFKFVFVLILVLVLFLYLVLHSRAPAVACVIYCGRNYARNIFFIPRDEPIDI